MILRNEEVNGRDVQYLYSFFFNMMEITGHHHNLDGPEPINPEATVEEILQHYA